MSTRRYVMCDDCDARIMLPRWAESGIPWTCMQCTGESAGELIEWANDQRAANAEHAEVLADEVFDDVCVRDDSTECNCSRCGAGDGQFWRDQGEDATA